jgi:hypothetical protein
MGDVADIYELSPLQQGMLFHALSAPGAGVDIEQIIVTLHESLDVATFEQAWRDVMQRHPILRTRFRWKDVAEPCQEVLAQCLEESSGSASTHAPQRNWRRAFAVQNSGLVGIAACRWFDEAAQDRCKQFTDEMNRVEAEPSHLVVLIRHLATNYVTDCRPTNNEREKHRLGGVDLLIAEKIHAVRIRSSSANDWTS